MSPNAVNVGMAVFDLALRGAAVSPPRVTPELLGHGEPSPDAVAHATAAAGDRPEDRWALAWLRGAEIATDALWSRSPAFGRPLGRAAFVGGGVANLAMAAAFARRARKP